MARATVQQAAQVQAALQQQTDAAGQRLAEQFATFRGRVEQVIRQTQRRVLDGEQVPAGEKLVSLFAPHTAIIRQGKPGKPVEFGRDVWLDEVAGGISSRYEILPGNPPDAEQLRPSLEQHRRVFKKPPDLLVGIGGSTRPATKRMQRRWGSSRWSCPNRAANQRNASRMNSSGGSGGAGIGGRGSQGGSAG